MCLLNDLFMSKVERVESELRKLSQAELRQVHEWLNDIIEDELEFTPEFEHSIQQAERDMTDGKSARDREPDGSGAHPVGRIMQDSTSSSSTCHRFCAAHRTETQDTQLLTQLDLS
jgi:hypothetical protein